MKGNRSLFIAVGVVAVLILGWWLFGRGGDGRARIDLIDRFDGGREAPDPGSFAVEDVTINGETKKSDRHHRPRRSAPASSSRRAFPTTGGCACRWR